MEWEQQKSEKENISIESYSLPLQMQDCSPQSIFS